jgi:hypothetical protein
MSAPGTFKTIANQDATITPFKVYKSWAYSTTSSLDADGLDRLVAIKPNYNTYDGNKVTLDSWQTLLDTGSYLINAANSKEASVIWYSLDHLYYKRDGKPYETFGYADPFAIERTLFDVANVISVPQKKLGEGIKPNSVVLRYTAPTINSATVYLTDDGKGNLIDTTLSSSVSNQILYVGFDQLTYHKAWNSTISTTSNSSSYYLKLDSTITDLTAQVKNVQIVPTGAIPSIGGGYGNAAYFTGDSYIRIPNQAEFNFNGSDNFAISFWIYPTSTATTQYILSKRTNGIGNILSKGIITTDEITVNTNQYPFDIYYSTSGEVVAVQSYGTTNVTVSSAVALNTPTHIVVQKSGSYLEIYNNGTLSLKQLGSTSNTNNIADIFIGSLGINNIGNVVNGFNGGLDDLFIFNKTLNQSEITQLSNVSTYNLMTTNTNVVGNVFYEHGIIAVSDPRPKYGNKSKILFNDRTINANTNITGSGILSNFYLSYNSTVTLYEHEYTIRLNDDEFNFTTNPTIRKNNNLNAELPKDFVSNTEFSPYITTIGLYDEYGQLLAIGKLGTPIKKRDNVDTTFVVRFDI